jgi:hypothetical protein
MKNVKWALGLLALGLTGISGRASAEPLTDAAVQDVARRFGAELKCAGAADTSPGYLNRHWCPVAKVESSGAFKAPAARRTMLGFTMQLQKDGKVVPAALATTDLAILTVGPDGALLTSLKPSNEKEKESLTPVVASLALVVKGKTAAVDLPADLQEYLKSFDAKALHPVKPLAAGAEYSGKIPARIYRVTGTLSGESYVVIEQASNGWFINLFPATSK